MQCVVLLGVRTPGEPAIVREIPPLLATFSLSSERRKSKWQSTNHYEGALGAVSGYVCDAADVLGVVKN